MSRLSAALIWSFGFLGVGYLMLAYSQSNDGALLEELKRNQNISERVKHIPVARSVKKD